VNLDGHDAAAFFVVTRFLEKHEESVVVLQHERIRPIAIGRRYEVAQPLDVERCIFRAELVGELPLLAPTQRAQAIGRHAARHPAACRGDARQSRPRPWRAEPRSRDVWGDARGAADRVCGAARESADAAA